MSDPHVAGREYLRLVALGALIGIPSALVAALFLTVVQLAIFAVRGVAARMDEEWPPSRA